MKNIGFWLIVVFSLLIDQVTKFFLHDVNLVLIPGILSLTSTNNTGFALGLMPGSPLPALVLSLLVLIGLFVLFRRMHITGLSRVGLALVIGGALGNLVDRLLLSYVRDMFELLFIRFYVFNIADVCVTLGAMLTAIGLMRNEKEWVKK